MSAREADTASLPAPWNPSFPLTIADAKADLHRMADEPKPLARPLLILDGYLDPHIAASFMQRLFHRLTHDDRIVSLSFATSTRFSTCREKVVAAVQRRFPTDDAERTQLVDVVGFSMGGLIGRYAAADLFAAAQQRLHIARLFTISTPHRGADLAALPTPIPLQREMRIGSPFIRDLAKDLQKQSYEIYPYVRLRDRIVGVENAAPEGGTPWWVPVRSWSLPHVLAFRDPRILAESARRLRGEQPFTHEPPAALPSQAHR